VFLRDRLTGVTERISETPEGHPGRGRSLQPTISPDGRYVLFLSRAGNLVGEELGSLQVLRHDRVSGTTTRVSRASDGTVPNRDAAYPSMSADGQRVVYLSKAKDIVAPPDRNWDAFLFDTTTGTTIKVTPDRDRVKFDSPRPAISADGSTIAYAARDYVDGTPFHSIVLYDVRTGTRTKVVDLPNGQECYEPSLSADGRYVVFTMNPVPRERTQQIAVLDVVTGDFEIISRGPDGEIGNRFSENPSISADGSRVAFTSWANLVEDDDNVLFDVFVVDRTTDELSMLSRRPDGAPANDSSFHATISADGSFVAFASRASDMLPADPDPNVSVFGHRLS
jgi:Tol biopolymer transport system component